MTTRKLGDHGPGVREHVSAASGLGLINAQNERLDTAYPLDKLYSTAHNPRRLSLDKAGVTDARVRALCIRPTESADAWQTRLAKFLEEQQAHLSPRQISVWEKIFDLAVSVHTGSLIQPIIASTQGALIAGERRWTALRLAGKAHGPVVLREVDTSQLALHGLTENTLRANLSVAEIALSVRSVVKELTNASCGIENRAISMKLIQSYLGVRKTQASYYRAICLLPEEDPLLERILDDEFSSLAAAYAEASERVRVLLGHLPAPDAAPAETQESTETTSSPAAPQSRMPSFKTRIPGTEGGTRFLSALGQIAGLPDDVKLTIQKTIDSWPAAPDKARKQMLEQMLEQVFTSLDQLDDDGEGDDGGAC